MSYRMSVPCYECGGVGMMLSDMWLSWHDDHGHPETEPPKYITCVFCNGKGRES